MSLTNPLETLLHIKRWITASIKHHLERNFLTEGLYLYVEGDDRLTNDKREYLELRIDGPYVKPNGSKGEYCAYVEVNILSNVTRKEEEGYNRENIQGVILHMLAYDICVYKMGNVGKKTIDDESQFGILQLIPSDQIKLSDFGMIDPNTEVYQAVGEAHYEMYFTI
jgi:hypothetical protein